MNGACGPPASPTVMRASATTMISPAAAPSTRSARRRRPDGSANTGLACTTGSLVPGTPDKRGFARTPGFRRLSSGGGQPAARGQELEHRGLIVRRNDPRDRRLRIPVITEQGEAQRATVADACTAVEDSALTGFHHDQIQAFRHILITIIGDSEDPGSCL